MKCPTCDHRFRQFSSWPLALGRPVICGECGTAGVRQGRWRPLILAALALFAFSQFIGMFALTTIGTLLVLIGLVLLSMTLDERLMVLQAVSDGTTTAFQKKDRIGNDSTGGDPSV